MIEFFDKVFIISLPESYDRRKLIEGEMKEHGIEYEIFEATKDEVGFIGLLKTIKKLFTECLEKGYQNVWVNEDDCTFLCPPVAFINEVWPQLPISYHCLYIGLNLLSPPQRISENVLKIGSAYSSHSIVYSREAMRIILTILEQQMDTPFDILLMQHLQPLHECYCTFPMLATQKEGYSFIEKKKINWATVMSMTYSKFTKNI